MPSPMASAVPWIATGRPSKVISPVSADSAPERILIRVDLPAPFSPTRAWTSPVRTVMSALRMARTAPNRLETPRTDSRSGGAPVPDRGEGAASVAPVAGGSLIVSSRSAVTGGEGRGGPALPGSSVVVVGRVVLGDPQRRAEQEHLGLVVVGHAGDLVADVVGGLELLALRELHARPRGQVPEVLDVPEDAGAGRAVLQVGQYRLRRPEPDGEDLADLPGVPHGLRHTGRRRGALADQAGQVGVGVHQVGRHLG